jgi:hypothetical protein
VALEYLVAPDNTSSIKSFLINGKPFDENKTYRVLVLSHLPRGHFEGSVLVEDGAAPIYGPLPKSYQEEVIPFSPRIFDVYVFSSPVGEKGLRTLKPYDKLSIKCTKKEVAPAPAAAEPMSVKEAVPVAAPAQ